jgi:monofunctional biosynthetic peptidoglycan transglycosylase
LRIVRNLFLTLLLVLLLPYLLVPIYRAGHPVSTLMAWRYMTGAPVSRQWIDFAAISPSLPRSVVAAEDAKFCSHHGIDWDALRDVIDDAEDGEVAAGLDHHPAGGEKPVPVAEPQRGPQGTGISARAVDRSGAAEAAHLEIYLNIAELGPPASSGASRRHLCVRPPGVGPVAARSGVVGGDPSQSGQRSARNPGPGCRLAGTYMARAQASGLRRCWSENRAF